MLRRFYRLQLERAQVREDPTVRISAPKRPRRLPKSLSEKQVEALLAAPDVDRDLGLRDRAMLETLYASGLRVSELVGLKRSQVAIDAGVVRVLGKGSKERLVPLGEEAIDWIRRYLSDARPRLAGDSKSDHVFVTARGGPMTRQAFWALIKRYARRRGHSGGNAVAACAAARVRDASAEPRRRPSRRAAAARPRGHHDHDDLYARRARAAEAAACAASSARVERIAVPARIRYPAPGQSGIIGDAGLGHDNRPNDPPR